MEVRILSAAFEGRDGVHSQATIAKVLALRQDGLGARRIASRTGLPVGTVRDWLAGGLPAHARGLVAGARVEAELP